MHMGKKRFKREGLIYFNQLLLVLVWDSGAVEKVLGCNAEDLSSKLCHRCRLIFFITDISSKVVDPI